MGWLNGNDILYPGALQLLSDIFNSQDEVSWLTGQYNAIDSHDRILHVNEPKRWNRYHFLQGDCRYIQQPSTYWRRTLWNKAGGYIADKFVAFDFELWVRFFRYAKLYTMYGLIGGHRFHHKQQERQDYGMENIPETFPYPPGTPQPLVYDRKQDKYVFCL